MDVLWVFRLRRMPCCNLLHSGRRQCDSPVCLVLYRIYAFKRRVLYSQQHCILCFDSPDYQKQQRTCADGFDPLYVRFWHQYADSDNYGRAGGSLRRRCGGMAYCGNHLCCCRSHLQHHFCFVCPGAFRGRTCGGRRNTAGYRCGRKIYPRRCVQAPGSK